MDKETFLRILEASLLLFDGVPEEEVIKLLDSFSVTCANYITNFVKSYKLS